MTDAFKIMRFGLPYVRRYWLRFTLGIFFGFIFGLSNGLTLGGVSLVLNRMDDRTRRGSPRRPRKARPSTACIPR